MKLEFHASMSNDFTIDHKTLLELNEMFRTIVCGKLGIAPDDTDVLWETYVRVDMTTYSERDGKL